jgi:hypothetical protein
MTTVPILISWAYFTQDLLVKRRKITMAERVSDERRMELVAMITSAYISSFNGGDMRPPDAITIARFIEDITDKFDEKYPRED